MPWMALVMVFGCGQSTPQPLPTRPLAVLPSDDASLEPVRVEQASPFDPSWVWLQRNGAVVAVDRDGKVVDWPWMNERMEADWVDPTRGRFLRRRDGRIESVVLGSIETLTQVEGDWAVDHDGTVVVVEDGRSLWVGVDGQVRQGAELPKGHELVGVTQGVVCTRPVGPYGSTAEATCIGPDGARHFERPFRASPNVSMRFENGLLVWQNNRQGTFGAMVRNPVDGATLGQLGSGAPGYLVPSGSTSMWTVGEFGGLVLRGIWNANWSNRDFDGGPLWGVAVSEDGLSVVVRVGRSPGTLFHVHGKQWTRLPFRALSARVVAPTPDPEAYRKQRWPDVPFRRAPPRVVPTPPPLAP